MTTFTSEDRTNAIKIVEEAPYHPGYEDAVVIKSPDVVNPLIDELNEMQDYILCPMDILDTVRGFIDEYIDQEVHKKIDEIDDTIKNIKL